MSQIYTLVPLPFGSFAGVDPVSRMIFGMIYDRLRLSSYNLTGGDDSWFDELEGRAFCVFAQAELAQLVGVSERSVRRSLEDLRARGLVWWRKATFRGANRFFVPDDIMIELRSASKRPD